MAARDVRYTVDRGIYDGVRSTWSGLPRGALVELHSMRRRDGAAPVRKLVRIDSDAATVQWP